MRQKITDWLTLFRAHSTGGTLIPLLIGAGSTTGTLINIKIIPLIIVGTISHWAVFAYNDIIDYKIDKKHEKNNKPLISGAIDKKTASIVVYLMMIIALVSALFIFNLSAFLFLLISYVLGITYNYRSKKDWYSLIYLSIWGFTITLTGALYMGQPTTDTWMIGFVISIFVGYWTIIGDYKDAHQDDEKSLLKLTGIDILYINDNLYIRPTLLTGIILYAVMIIMIGLLILITLSASLYITIIVLIFSALSYWYIIQMQVFNSIDEIKSCIGATLITFAIAGIFASTAFLNIPSILLLLSIPLIFGSIIRLFLYGSLLRVDIL